MNHISTKKQNNHLKLETNDFPHLCDTCLGNSNFIKMTKAEFDLECRLCSRPFVVFRWKSDFKKFKRTEICKTCSKVKHLCQSCLLDLRFGLTMDERDSMLKKKIEIPKDQTNKDYWSYKMSKNIDKLDLPYNKDENYSILDKYLFKDKIIKNELQSTINKNITQEDNIKNKDLILNEKSTQFYKRGIYLNNDFSDVKFEEIKFKK